MLPTDVARGWRVLIVDDYYDNVVVAQATLEYYGAIVDVAPDGQSALGLIETAMPTALLVDLSMPGMNGWELLQVLKERPDMTLVPVIAVTAHAMAEDRGKVLAAGFDDYIAKPYDIHSLIPCIQSALIRKREGQFHG